MEEKKNQVIGNSTNQTVIRFSWCVAMTYTEFSEQVMFFKGPKYSLPKQISFLT